MGIARACALAVAIGLTGCSSDDGGGRGRLGDACGEEIRECGDLLVCLVGRCRQACVTNTDCTSLEACDEGVCMGLDEYCAGLDNVGRTAVDTAGGARACVIEDCAPGWEDLDGQWDNGCEEICAPSGPERCNGADDDCSGLVDDVADIASDCGSRFLTAAGVEAWTCMGVCEIASCLDGYRDANGAKADGCELQCTISGSEVCDGLDNDCNGVADDLDLAVLASACAGELPGAVHVASWACISGACTIDQCVGGWTDITGGVSDGCEAACTPTIPATEVCDGSDNDCDGMRDPEDAPGCTVYYQDADADGRGGVDSRCLCAPSAPHTVTVGGDCDDTLSSCGLDCTTDLDGDGAVDCADTCVDLDGDGYGDPGGLGACVDSDCDDTPGQCGVACHPGLEEICDGWDNDCDGGWDTPLVPALCELQLGVCAGATSPGCGGSSGWQPCNGSTYSSWAQSQLGVQYQDAGGDESLCDFFDNDCDGTVDDGCEIVFEGINIPNDVTALAVDAAGNLWLGDNNNAHYLAFGDDTFEMVSGLDNRSVTAIALEPDGDAWIGEDQGFCPGTDFDPPCQCGVYHVPADRQATPELYCTEGMGGNYSSATALVVDDATGRVFIGTREDFTIYFPAPFDRADCDIDLLTGDDEVRGIALDDRVPQNLYVGTRGGFAMCDLTNLAPGGCNVSCSQPLAPINGVHEIVFWDRGNADPSDDAIWVGTRDAGVWLVNLAPFQILGSWSEPYLPYRRVDALALDEVEEKVFVGTRNGLSVYDVASDQWRTFDEPDLPNGEIQALAFDAAHGILWIGTKNNEVMRAVVHWP